MPLPRMTTRRWMIAVAATASALGALQWRRSEFESLAASHESRTIAVVTVKNGRRTFTDQRGRRLTPVEAKRSNWRWALSQKYERAARYPWLPVPPDPPPPE